MWHLPLLRPVPSFHSARDPGRCKLSPEQCALKTSYWLFWYEADHVYAVPAVCFLALGVLLFAIARLVADHAPERLTRTPAWRRSVSALRLLAYRSWRVGGRNLQPVGALLLAALCAVFFAAMAFGPRPLYWPADARYGGSPPLATRSGWLALACLPFVMALAAKANLVSALTAASPGTINAWHGWIAWAMFLLAIAHAAPFVALHSAEGDLARAFHKGGTWLTGIVAIGAQAWLTLMSVPSLRDRWYEFFKATHCFFAATFVVVLFLHCAARLTSWDYFVAAGAIYLGCLLWACARALRRHGLGVAAARLRLETPDALRVAVQTGSGWRPGQHFHVRFLTGGLHALSSHPFTACSLPDAAAGAQHELLFHLQPRAGLTRRLAGLAGKQADRSVSVLLEGPYGGLPARWYRGFDRTLLLAGGSGCGFTLPLIHDWLRRRGPSSTRSLAVVLASRDPAMPAWYLRELRRVTERQHGACPGAAPRLSLSIYQTGGPPPEDALPGGDEEKGARDEPRTDAAPVDPLFDVDLLRGRPDAAAAVACLASRTPLGSVGIAVCGPAGMVHDVAAAAAAQQRRILRGRGGASEVWLHRESFS